MTSLHIHTCYLNVQTSLINIIWRKIIPLASSTPVYCIMQIVRLPLGGAKLILTSKRDALKSA